MTFPCRGSLVSLNFHASTAGVLKLAIAFWNKPLMSAQIRQMITLNITQTGSQTINIQSYNITVEGKDFMMILALNSLPCPLAYMSVNDVNYIGSDVQLVLYKYLEQEPQQGQIINITDSWTYDRKTFSFYVNVEYTESEQTCM